MEPLPSLSVPGRTNTRGDPAAPARHRRAPSGSAAAPGTPGGVEGQGQRLSCGRDRDPREDVGVFPGGRALPAGEEGRGQPPREGTAVAERRLAQRFRQLFLLLLLLRLLGSLFSPSQTCPAGKLSPHGGFPPWQSFRGLSARWFPELP